MELQPLSKPPCGEQHPAELKSSVRGLNGKRRMPLSDSSAATIEDCFSSCARSRWWYVLSSWRRPRKPKKPPSNPPGWAAGRTTEHDLAKRPNRVVVINGEQEAEFAPNIVKTAKYKYHTFLPRFLWEEFNPSSKIANVYFLFIAGLQVIPSITNTFGIPLMLLPLFFVVGVDAVFMIIEDVVRHRADKLANSSPTRGWNCNVGAFKRITWDQIQVGDLILIKNREPIPCDVLILGVNESNPQSPSGIAYVETKSLDGETNLKIRQVVKGALGTIAVPEDCAFLTGRVIMEHPDKLINNFKGKILLGNAKRKHGGGLGLSHSQGDLKTCGTIPDGLKGNSGSQRINKDVHENNAGVGSSNRGASESYKVTMMLSTRGCSTTGDLGLDSRAIAPDMLLLRGCVLRNTRWAVGLVLNTGPDTKIMMSMSKAPSKASHLSRRINEEIKLVAGVMGAVCLVGAMLSTIWSSQYHNKKWYLKSEVATGALTLARIFFTQFLYYTLLLNSFIPISLYVSMNFVRFLQGWLMNQDLDMYYAESNTPARVRTMNLNEDLGQVSHIFSDKTGTLTCNIMDFRKFSVGGVSYGLGITEISRSAMAAEGETVPEDVLRADVQAKNNAVPHVNFYDPSVYKDLQGNGPGGKEQVKRIKDFFTALALCHTVLPERSEETDEVMLSASSPDDEALVLGAKYFGFEFVNRIDLRAVLKTWDVSFIPPPPTATATADPKMPPGNKSNPVTRSPTRTSPRRGTVWAGTWGVKSPVTSNATAKSSKRGTGNEQKIGESGVVTQVSYEVLQILGFTSDRKRMSVIVRTPEGSIKLICKGADTVMLPRLAREGPGGAEKFIGTTVEHMDTFAREGLRTLVVAQAELDSAAYEEWANDFEEASSDLGEIDKRDKGEPNRIEAAMDVIERNLQILGASAIEDKLQAGVSDTISDLMAAGIKIWVLTGDKEETAVNIAVACQLLWTKAKMHRTVIRLRGTGESETKEIKEELEDFLQRSIEERNRFEEDETGEAPLPLPRGLIIDGPALLEAMRTPESQAALLRAAQTCHSVVGCRLSPDQKRALVSLVRENVPRTRTLAIGDGANDVPMIQTAHIGVGMSGQEGMQAVNSSDYAIAQFAYLRKLLLVHGRWNYRRSSRVVCYLFYKSVMFACPLIVYAFANGYSGTLFYDYITANMYAVLYTALPILLFGTYDRDASAETCLRFPELYAYGIQGGYMRRTIFWSWMLQAFLESGFLTLAPLLLFSGGFKAGGVVTSTYDYGTMTFSLIVIQASLKMFWVQNRWTWLHIIVLLASAFAYFLSAFVVNAWIYLNWDYYGVVYLLLHNRPCWAVMAWCIVVVAGRDWAWKFHHRWWRPRLHHLVLESEKCKENTPALANTASSSAVKIRATGDKEGGGAGGEIDLEAAARLRPEPRKSPTPTPTGKVIGFTHDSQLPIPASLAMAQSLLPPPPDSRENSVRELDSTDSGAQSIKALLESNFSTNPTEGQKDATVPIRMGALARTVHQLRERGAYRGHRPGFSSRIAKANSPRGPHPSSGTSSGGLAEAFAWIGGARNRKASICREVPLAATKESTDHGAGEAGGNQFADVILDEEPRHKKKNSRSMRAGDLMGLDPREADKLMRTRASYVDVGGNSASPPRGRAATVVRRSSESGRVLSPSSRRGSARMGRTRRFSDSSTGVRNSVDAPDGCWSNSSMSIAAPSRGGYAFSCDPQAQEAEIAMILGHRPGALSRSSSFHVQRSSLHADRIVHPRIANLEGTVNEGDVWDPATQLQRRYSFAVGREEKRTAEGRKGSKF